MWKCTAAANNCISTCCPLNKPNYQQQNEAVGKAAFFDSKAPALDHIRGLGPKRREALSQQGITSLYDLLDCLPRGYLNARQPQPISTLRTGEACVEGQVVSAPSLQYYAGRSIVRARVRDASGSLSLAWFNQPWMARQVKAGSTLILYGLVQRRGEALTLTNPKMLKERGIIPQYRPLPGLPGKVFAGFITQALALVDPAEAETLPHSFRQWHGLLGRAQAWLQAHQPEDMDQLAAAQRRLGFENLLLYQLAIRLAGPADQAGPRITVAGSFAQEFWGQLPFSPTGAQRDTLNRVLQDLRGPQAMRRLVQGDVGSGKTAVAFGAALAAIRGDYQCALMAPTELLARQHYSSATQLLAPFGITCGLLLGGLRAAQRREALDSIQSGAWQLIIGTHALISKDVVYHKLGLAITDEQHRFGVRQRQTLAERGDDLTPHLLALSATPIPRSLALVLYGDLRVSVMDEMPPGRTPVRTRVVPPQRRDDLYQYIREKAQQGEQSYLVCPLVEDSGDAQEEKTSALSLYRQLRDGPLKGIGMALTWGSQEEAEKNKALEDFYAGRAQVLVSTTVVEVGMDVPNATTMVVEDAEYFGLAQLHQLRGRVGRGSKESWCFLLGEPNERLNILTQTNDGFVIAQKDLELRGPGEFLGTRQHGRALGGFGITDVRLLEETASCLEELLNQPSQRPLYDYLARLARERYADALEQTGLH